MSPASFTFSPRESGFLPEAVSAVLSDSDGTLVDTGSLFKAAKAAALERGGIEVGDAIRQGILSKKLDERQIVDQVNRLTGAALTVGDYRQNYVAATLELIPQVDIPVAAGAVEFFAGLAAHGLPRGVASNGQEPSVRRIFQKVGLDELFSPDKIIVSSMPGMERKPAPTMLVQFARNLAAVTQDVFPRHMVYIGDDPMDMAAATHAGCIPIGIMPFIKPDKAPEHAAKLVAAGARAVVSGYGELAESIRPSQASTHGLWRGHAFAVAASGMTPTPEGARA